MAAVSPIYQIYKAYASAGPAGFERVVQQHNTHTVCEAVRMYWRKTKSLDLLDWIVNGSAHIVRAPAVLNDAWTYMNEIPQLLQLNMLDMLAKHHTDLHAPALIAAIRMSGGVNSRHTPVFVQQLLGSSGSLGLGARHIKDAVEVLCGIPSTDPLLIPSFLSANAKELRQRKEYTLLIAQTLADSHYPFTPALLTSLDGTDFLDQMIERSLLSEHPQSMDMIQYAWPRIKNSAGLIMSMFINEKNDGILSQLLLDKHKGADIQATLVRTNIAPRILEFIRILPYDYVNFLIPMVKNPLNQSKILSAAMVTKDPKIWDAVFSAYKEGAQQYLQNIHIPTYSTNVVPLNVLQDVHSLGDNNIDFLNNCLKSLVWRNSRYCLELCKHHAEKELDWTTILSQSIVSNKMSLARHLAQHHPAALNNIDPSQFEGAVQDRFNTIAAQCQRNTINTAVGLIDFPSNKKRKM